MSKQMLELAEELREYTAMKYAGDCKCGKCQLVPRRLVERIYHALNSTAIRSSADSAQPVGPFGRENDAFHRALSKYPASFEALHSFWNDAFGNEPQTVDTTEALRKQAFALSCHEQFRLASFVAENLGYVLSPDPLRGGPAEPPQCQAVSDEGGK